MRNLTNSSGSAEIWPAWSPDGQSVSTSVTSQASTSSTSRPRTDSRRRANHHPRAQPVLRAGVSPNGRQIAFQDTHYRLWRSTSRVAARRWPTPIRSTTPTGPSCRCGVRTRATSRTPSICHRSSAPSTYTTSRRARSIRSPMASPTRRRPRGMRAASISGSSGPRTTASTRPCSTCRRTSARRRVGFT